MKNCVYILLCKNGRYYIGNTIDLDQRVQQHELGLVKATRKVRPVSLIFFQVYPTIQSARRIEYWLKRQKDKNFVKKIIKEKASHQTLC